MSRNLWTINSCDLSDSHAKINPYPLLLELWCLCRSPLCLLASPLHSSSLAHPSITHPPTVSLWRTNVSNRFNSSLSAIILISSFGFGVDITSYMVYFTYNPCKIKVLWLDSTSFSFHFLSIFRDFVSTFIGYNFWPLDVSLLLPDKYFSLCCNVITDLLIILIKYHQQTLNLIV